MAAQLHHAGIPAETNGWHQVGARLASVLSKVSLSDSEDDFEPVIPEKKQQHLLAAQTFDSMSTSAGSASNGMVSDRDISDSSDGEIGDDESSASTRMQLPKKRRHRAAAQAAQGPSVFTSAEEDQWKGIGQRLGSILMNVEFSDDDLEVPKEQTYPSTISGSCEKWRTVGQRLGAVFKYVDFSDEDDSYYAKPTEIQASCRHWESVGQRLAATLQDVEFSEDDMHSPSSSQTTTPAVACENWMKVGQRLGAVFAQVESSDEEIAAPQPEQADLGACRNWATVGQRLSAALEQAALTDDEDFAFPETQSSDDVECKLQDAVAAPRSWWTFRHSFSALLTI